MTAQPPLYVTQLVDALGAADQDIQMRAGQRATDWLVAAHANRATVLIECLPTGYDVRAGDTYLAIKVDLERAVRTVRRALGDSLATVTPLRQPTEAGRPRPGGGRRARRRGRTQR